MGTPFTRGKMPHLKRYILALALALAVVGWASLTFVTRWFSFWQACSRGAGTI